MATTPPNNEAFLREVDEELRRDQMVSIWRNYGRWIIAAVVLGLAIFAAVLWWQSHKAAQAGEQGEKLSLAYKNLSANKIEPAKASLGELAKSDLGGYRALARMTQADIKLKAADLKGAATDFAAVAADGKAPQELRDAALVRQTAIEFDQLKPDVVLSRLRPLATKGSAWFGSAGEMVAAAYVAQGKRAQAAQLLGEIAKAEGVPETLRQRAVRLSGALKIDSGAGAQAKAEEKKTK